MFKIVKEIYYDTTKGKFIAKLYINNILYCEKVNSLREAMLLTNVWEEDFIINGLGD